MRRLDLAGLKDGDKWRRSRGFFHGGASTSFLAFHQAGGADHLEAKVARSLNGLNGGTARGAHVVHDDPVRAPFLEAFNTPAQSLGLLRLAHQKAMNGCAELRTDHGDRYHQRVSSKG